MLLFLESNYLFSASLFFVLAVTIIEILMVFIGHSLSGLIDDGFESNSNSILVTWANQGKLPFLIFILILLGTFGSLGILIQHLSNNIFSQYIILIPVLILTVIITKVLSKLLSKILPSDQTDAVSTKTFIGLTATITNGIAEKGNPSEAKLLDENGNTHYIMVEPIEDNESFRQNDKAVIIQQEGHIFYIAKEISF